MHFEQEVAHLHKAAELLARYENKQWQQVIPGGHFLNSYSSMTPAITSQYWGSRLRLLPIGKVM